MLMFLTQFHSRKPGDERNQGKENLEFFPYQISSTHLEKKCLLIKWGWGSQTMAAVLLMCHVSCLQSTLKEMTTNMTSFESMTSHKCRMSHELSFKCLLLTHSGQGRIDWSIPHTLAKKLTYNQIREKY